MISGQKEQCTKSHAGLMACEQPDGAGQGSGGMQRAVRLTRVQDSKCKASGDRVRGWQGGATERFWVSNASFLAAADGEMQGGRAVRR